MRRLGDFGTYCAAPMILGFIVSGTLLLKLDVPRLRAGELLATSLQADQHPPAPSVQQAAAAAGAAAGAAAAAAAAATGRPGRAADLDLEAQQQPPASNFQQQQFQHPQLDPEGPAKQALATAAPAPSTTELSVGDPEGGWAFVPWPQAVEQASIEMPQSEDTEVATPVIEMSQRQRQQQFRDRQHASFENDTEVRIFHDATVTPEGGIMVNKTRAWLPYRGCGEPNKYHPKAENCLGPAHAIVVLTQGAANVLNHYHFFAEFISRVMWVHEQHPEFLASKRTLYHTTCVTDTCNILARMAGINTAYGPGSHLVQGCWTAKIAAWPPSSLGCSNPRPHALRSLNAYLLRGQAREDEVARQDAPASQASPNQVDERPVAVLIKRSITKSDRTTPRRIIRNHDEVLQEIERAGWAVKEHEAHDLGMETQCRMFYEAELLVGPHGAGLTNMLCSCPGTVVLEIKQSNGGFNKSFLRLAEALGLEFVGLDVLPPFSLPYDGIGKVNASAVGEAAAQVLKTRGQRRRPVWGRGCSARM